jgi:nucleotide-binding universal stress UspA family protein
MKPIQKILVPTDFSEHSHVALGYAAEMAKGYSASISLAHVYPVVNYAAAEGFALYTPEQLAQLRAELGAQLRTAEDELRAQGVSHVDATLVQGDAFKELVALAPAYDMIVMGTHGRTGFKHALIGSIAEKVVRTVTCPVLTVRSASSTQ